MTFEEILLKNGGICTEYLFYTHYDFKWNEDTSSRTDVHAADDQWNDLVS